jgi:hypothetical protein
MAQKRDEELLTLQEDAALAAAQAGADPAELAAQLAGTQTAAMGANLADRYAQMGAKWLSDPVPTRLDADLIQRLSRHGFRSETLADVRVHRGPKAQAAADALGARAFAIGENDVFFGTGEFDPSTRSGRAVLAHELAHIAPPTDFGPASAGAGMTGGSAFGGLGAPVLNERKTGDEDASGAEAHERRARRAEAQVFAQEDQAGAPAMAAGPGTMTASQGGQSGPAEIDPQALESKVLSIISRLERTEVERAGEF